MPKPRINGSLAPIKKPTEVDFDPTRGLVVRSDYESAGDNLGGLANTFLNAGIAFRWKSSGVRSSIEATYSGGTNGLPDEPAQTWQLLANEGQKSIFEGFVASLLDEVTIAGVKSAVSDAQGGDFAAYNGLSGAALTLASLAIRGTTHFATGQYALKRTVSVSNFYPGTVLLGSEAFSETLIPMAAILNLGIPATITTLLLGIPAPPFQPGYFWSWRQLPSSAVISAYNKTEISTEWWLDQWSTTLYALA